MDTLLLERAETPARTVVRTYAALSTSQLDYKCPRLPICSSESTELRRQLNSGHRDIRRRRAALQGGWKKARTPFEAIRSELCRRLAQPTLIITCAIKGTARNDKNRLSDIEGAIRLRCDGSLERGMTTCG